jgi:predicted permease
MDQLRQDLRLSLRSLLRRPGFSITAIGMLALGIGMNTAMFSVIRGVLLEPLPYAEPDRLVRLYHVNPAGGVDAGDFSPHDYDDIVAATSDIALASFWHAPGLSMATLRGDGDATLLEAAYVSREFFDVLGTPPVLGRYPTPAEQIPGADRVAVLSESLWRSSFGGAADIVGRTIDLHGGNYTVVGVAPAAFAYPSADVAVWLPLSHVTGDWIPRRRGIRYLGVVGRLDGTVEPATVQAELSGVAERLAQAYVESNADWRTVRLQSVGEELLGSVRTPLLVLAGSVMLVLLIVCANLVNLLLARATSRSNELAIRAALGAGRARIARQLVTENVVLALAGGIAGVLCAVWITSLMTGLAGAELPRSQNVGIDASAFGFALLLSLLTGVLTALMPAWRAGLVTGAVLRDGGTRGTTEGRSRRNVRGMLVAAEMTLAFVLVVGAGLMLRSLDQLTNVNPGFDADNVLAVSLTLSSERVSSLEASLAYRAELLAAISAVPGVENVGMAKSLPLAGGGEPYEFTIPGRTGEAALFRPEAGLQIVSPAYFEALRIPVLTGRGLAAEDASLDAPGIVINRRAAERYWPGEEAAGQVVMLGGQLPVRIVGVVGDVRHDGLHSAPAPAAYISIDRLPRTALRFLARTTTNPATLIASVRAAIREVDAAQPVAEIVPLRDTLARAMMRDRFLTVLIGAFAGLALVLAVLGIYGVVAYGVSQRLQEIGIRLALGADAGAVVRMITLQAAAWWAPGLLAGLAGAIITSRLLRGMVYGVSVLDPTTYVIVGFLLTAAALLATIVPAARATPVDPARRFGAGG